MPSTTSLKSCQRARTGNPFATTLPMAALVLSTALLAGAPASAAPVPLLPLYAGQYAAGGGANASFMQIDSAWQGSSVLWNETTHSYGSGVSIGSFGWGTGLWGQADWQTVQNTAQGSGGTNAPTIINQWTGIAPTINFGNAVYNGLYSATWGKASLLPFFDAAGLPSAQENWTAHFSGYIRVANAGNYNFSVLNDDGFFLRLIGDAGATLGIGRDFLNSRDRNGFADDLALSPGLYGFDLGMWNRLEAGVVDLRWMLPGSQDWTLVPTTNLVNKIPEPGSTLLLAAACLASAGVLRHRRGG